MVPRTAESYSALPPVPSFSMAAAPNLNVQVSSEAESAFDIVKGQGPIS